jgi:hypothetical protein
MKVTIMVSSQPMSDGGVKKMMKPFFDTILQG